MSSHNTLHENFLGNSILADPGNAGSIYADRSVCVVSFVSGASGETRTLQNPPRAGGILILHLAVDGGGDVAITVASAINSSGNTIITLNDAGDTVTLIGVPNGTTAFRWRVLVNDGASLS